MGGQPVEGIATDSSASASTGVPWLFIISTILIPILVALVPFIIRKKHTKNWTAAADVFVFLTGLELSILLNVSAVNELLPSTFSKHFSPTLAVLLALSFFLMVWSLYVEEDIGVYELRINCPVRQPGLTPATFPLYRVCFLWSIALALMVVNLYIVVGSALGIGG